MHAEAAIIGGMQSKLPGKDIVLIGMGHTHAHVLRMWRMRPIHGARLTCVSDHAIATYSGMLPGVLAGQYPRDRMTIDLVRLCAAAGARLIMGRLAGLDLADRRVHVEGRPSLSFDALSIGIGSVPHRDGLAGDDVVAIKPMQTFLDRLAEGLGRIAKGSGTVRIAIVGGGAGGVEIAFCLRTAARRMLPGRRLEIVLVDRGARLAPGMTAGSARRIQERLEAGGVRVLLGRKVERAGEGVLQFEDGERLEAGLILSATSAAAPPVLGRLDLPTDPNGFLLTRPTLETTAEAPVFAVGDSGTIDGAPTPKAGVYAVRQGPILWENIQRLLDGRPLRPFRPQSGFLKLINTGDGSAIGEYRGWTFEGRWCWRLKDWIDVRFMEMYQDYRPRPPMTAAGPAGAAMRCLGCGGKVGGTVLSRAIARLDPPASDQVLLGLGAADDAAVVRFASGAAAASVDFFAAPLDDPFLVGRIAALHSASDLFAKGLQPAAALALATIPVGDERQQAEMLHAALAGAVEEFKGMGAALVGGHTIEGPQFSLGFAVLADAGAGPLRPKSGLRPGDRLILTKPLGTGVLLAAHQQARCKAEWMEPLIATMLRSNQSAAETAARFQVSAATDVSGFGLAGHLLEMLSASGAAAEIDLDRIPLLAGFAELVRGGVESTLAPANRANAADVEASPEARNGEKFASLFDPQTAGGLLLGVAGRHAEELVQAIRAAGDAAAILIGRVTQRSPKPALRCTHGAGEGGTPPGEGAVGVLAARPTLPSR